MKRSESRLISRAQRGDEKAFAVLFETHKNRIYSLCLSILSNRSEAEGMTREIFLRVFREISALESEAMFATRLNRLTSEATLTYLRENTLPTLAS